MKEKDGEAEIKDDVSEEGPDITAASAFKCEADALSPISRNVEARG